MGQSQRRSPGMSAEAFVAWSLEQPPGARFELLDGQVIEMQAERLAHAEAKARVLVAFRTQIEARGLRCQALGDGMAVKVDGDTVFEPDALVRCGPRLPPDTVLLQDPLVVVEVASPATQKLDATRKLLRYFRNPAIAHYLVVVPTERTIIHHRRALAGEVISTTHESGEIVLDPPGLSLALADVFETD